MKKLLSSYPHLVKEWHPTKNGELTPKDFTHGSDKKVWWVCDKGHSFSTSVSDRTRQKPIGCKYCAGKKASKENNLETLFPDIAKEWHPTKNKELTPKDFTHGSHKKVWWLCPKGHDYKSAIANRTRMKSGCHYCAGKKASQENNLEALFPEIAKEWHPTKNKELMPNQVTYGSCKKVWWLCPKGHSYDSPIKSRTHKNHPTGCPYCSGNKVGEDNNLLAIFPEIAKEWHPTKNNELTPKEFTSRSGEKVWWLCPKNHSYEAQISNRTANQSGCPYCSGHRTLNYDLFK